MSDYVPRPLQIVNGFSDDPAPRDEEEFVPSDDPEILRQQCDALIEEGMAWLQARIPEGSIRPPVASDLFFPRTFADAQGAVELFNGHRVVVVTPLATFGGVQREVWSDHVVVEEGLDGGGVYMLAEATFESASWDVGLHDILRVTSADGWIEVHRVD